MKMKQKQLVIYTPAPKSEAEPLRVTLVDNGTGLLLVAVDKHGKRLPQGNLVELTHDGYIMRFPVVNPKLGFKLDCHGHIKLSKLAVWSR